MKEEVYVNKEMMKLLLEKGCPLDRVYVKDFRPVWYTKDYNDPTWQDCAAYYIPTQSQVMKWLRELGIVIIIQTKYPTNPELCKIPYSFLIEDYRPERDLKKEHGKYHTGYSSTAGMDDFLVKNNLLFDGFGFGEFKLYEQSCEAAIKYCLTNLI